MMRGGGIRTTSKKVVLEVEEEEEEEDLVFRIKENHYHHQADHGDDNEFGSLTPASSIAGSPTHHSRETLKARVDKWSEVTGGERPCAIVYVATECFHVHKEAISRCGYLRKLLTNASVVTVNPPLNITSQTFLMVAEFCYGADIVLSPDNLAALRIAAQLLEMSEDIHPGNLIMQTENYFLSMVTSDQDYATIILNSGVVLMPEAETVASLVSRCLEVLGLFRDGDMLAEQVEAVRLLKFEHFKLVAKKLRQLLPTKHDTLYIVIDQYIKGNGEKLTEEEKSDLCSLVDCVKLEPRLLIHAVQCPRMPLRFIVRAMFADQINTRRSITSATNKSNQPFHHRALHQPQPQMVNFSPESAVSAVDEEMTLGGILQRDAAIRHVEHIKQEMEMTSSKIKQLEEELKGMKTLLTAESEHNLSLSRIDSRRCTSLRILTNTATVSRVQRNERGSVSAIMLPRSLRTASSDHKTQRGGGGGGKGFGAKLFSGLKSVFRGSGSKQETESTGCRVGRKPKQNKHISC